VGFELLIETLIHLKATKYTYIKVYGDNKGVVEGWKTGRSRNNATNAIFRRIHTLCEYYSVEILTCYIPSASNPADKPSRGIYPPNDLLLPHIVIPHDLRPFISDINQHAQQAPTPVTSWPLTDVEPDPDTDEDEERLRESQQLLFEHNPPWKDE
jgi:hypothetical protein